MNQELQAPQVTPLELAERIASQFPDGTALDTIICALLNVLVEAVMRRSSVPAMQMAIANKCSETLISTLQKSQEAKPKFDAAVRELKASGEPVSHDNVMLKMHEQARREADNGGVQNKH